MSRGKDIAEVNSDAHASLIARLPRSLPRSIPARSSVFNIVAVCVEGRTQPCNLCSVMTTLCKLITMSGKEHSRHLLNNLVERQII